MDIQLNFVNSSDDASNSQIVIFQKNVATDFDDLTVAWQVIRNCGRGDNHPFIFPMTMVVAASDSWGNYTPPLTAQDGQLFTMQSNPSGDQLNHTGNGTSMTEVQVLNGLQKGAINASIYKDGKMLATKTAVAPQQKALFQFRPTIWIGAVSQISQGQVMNSAILSNIHTELPLLSVASADIVMTGGGPGGGPGGTSTPLRFNLQNITKA